jgi:asparagine synthase (glutamine-hydrolysing)
MCGIAGIVALAPHAASPTRAELVQMAAAIQHRGPDESGVFRDARAGLAHTRLSIIDLTTGSQPLCNEDETLWIVFNGEIFNYLELREELIAAGHHFRTSSDTEVIVHAYEQWGETAFARMNGQWAVALWDTRAERLVLARDRLGVRPLYLCPHAGRLYFASEVKAIFAADASIPRAFDPVGLEATFTFWSVVPPQSVFAGIEELRPGHVRIYAGGAVSERAYWTPQYPRAEEEHYPGSLEDAVREVRAALENAVALRMLRADVPVGSYLSGGLDSSLVAALGQKFARGAFQTYSLRFEDAEYDETHFQRQMAQSMQSDHHELVVSRDDIARVFPDVIHHTERPILRTAPAPLFLLSQLVRDSGIKVVLTGEGADEVFAGYDLFREGKVRRYWARQPQSQLRPRLLERLYPYLARSPVAQQAMARRFFGRKLEDHAKPGFAHGTRWEGTAALKRLLARPMREAVGQRNVVADLLADLPPEFPSWTPLAQDQYLETRTLLAGYLLSSQGDRVLMAHSVEGRFPFLDRDVIELANRLPASYKLRVLDEKHVLKRAARDLIPAEIVARKKQPYRAPDALSFLGTAAGYAEELLAPRAVAEAGVFEAGAVGQLWQKCKASGGAQLSNTDNMALVGVLSTQLLHHGFVRNRPIASRPVTLRVDVDRSEPRR